MIEITYLPAKPLRLSQSGLFPQIYYYSLFLIIFWLFIFH
jgi:hypothetical protein